MVGDYEIAVAQVVEQFRVMWCGRKEEDEEVRARWGMCAGAVDLYNCSTPDPLPFRDFGKPRRTRSIPS